MATAAEVPDFSELQNDFTIIPLEQNGHTDTTILDCLITTSMLSVGLLPKINSHNVDAVKDKLKRLLPWEADFTVQRSGSTMDKLFITKLAISDEPKMRVNFNTDIDLLFIPTSIFVSNHNVEDRACIAVVEPTPYDNYVKLKVNEQCSHKIPDIISYKSDGPYLSSARFLQLMESHMNEEQQAVKITGPSLTVQPEMLKGNTDSMTSFDLVFALRNKEFPQIAADWVTRARPNGWPCEAHVAHILQMGSHIVPKASKLSSDEEFDDQWRISFNDAERRLAEIMTTKQRHCFLVVKAIVKASNTNALSSYSLKTVVWWMLETGDSSIWEKQTFSRCLLLYLDDIISALEHYEIKNYFVPGNNVIGHVNRSEVDQIKQRLHKVRKAPISAILGNTILMENPAAVFDKVNENSDFSFNKLYSNLSSFNGEDSVRSFLLQFFKFHFINLGQVYTLDPNMHENALCFLKSFACICESTDDPMKTVISILMKSGMSGFGETDQESLESGERCLALLATIAPFEDLDDIFKRHSIPDDAFHHIYVNISCVLHKWSNIYFYETEREKCKILSERSFQHAISKTPTHPSGLAEYAHFLLVHERYSEAFKHAAKAIKGKPTEALLSYNTDDLDVIDTNIARHVEYEKEIIVPATVLAYYIIIQAAIQSKETDQIQQYLKEFVGVCEIHSKWKYECLSLLGYSYMALAIFSKAHSVFMEALALKESQLQLENIQICLMHDK